MLRVLGFALAAMIALAAQTSATVAGKIALKGGSADLMLSDWLWVARERSLGDDLVFYPSSSTLGAVMVPARSPIREIIDLRGRKLAVAGGPLDKSWLLLQALARRSGLDLKKQTTVVYGAPPLLSEKALQGETDATLTFWNFCADLESKGYTRAIAMDHVVKALGAKGPVALVGYTFDRAWAARNGSTLERFLAAARQAKDILASSHAEWQRLAPRIRVTDLDALAIYRQRYGEGIVRRSPAEEEADARALYLVLAEIGGAELVGPARRLAARRRAPASGSAGGGAGHRGGSAFGHARLQSRRDARARRGGVRRRDGARLGHRPHHGPVAARRSSRRSLADRAAQPAGPGDHRPRLCLGGAHGNRGDRGGGAEQAPDRDRDRARRRALARPRTRRHGAGVSHGSMDAHAPRHIAAARALSRRRRPLRPIAGLEDRAHRGVARASERRRLRDRGCVPIVRRHAHPGLCSRLHRGHAGNRNVPGAAV